MSSTATRTADAAGTSGEPKTIGCARLKLLSGRRSLLPETHFYIPSPILTTLPGRRKNAEQALQRPTKILRNPPYALGAMERAVVPTVTTAKLHRPERRTKGFSHRHAERERASEQCSPPPALPLCHPRDRHRNRQCFILRLKQHRFRLETSSSRPVAAPTFTCICPTNDTVVGSKPHQSSSQNTQTNSSIVHT